MKRPLYYPGANAVPIKYDDLYKYDTDKHFASAIPAGTKTVLEIDGENVTIHQQTSKKSADLDDFPFLEALRNHLLPRVDKIPRFTICGIIATGGDCEGGMILPGSLFITDVCSIEGIDLYGQPVVKRLVYMDKLFPGSQMVLHKDGRLSDYQWISRVGTSQYLYKVATFASVETTETFITIAAAIKPLPLYTALLIRDANAKLDVLYNSSYNTFGHFIYNLH